jgi:hypothetical protein
MKKRILKDIVLNEISGVTKPAQAPALATIMKSAEFGIIEKWFDPEVNYATATLQSLMSAEDRREDFAEIKNKIYSALEALGDGIAGVSSDDSLTPEDKNIKIASLVSDFVSCVNDKLTEDEIETVTKSLEENMAEIDDLKKALADTKAELEKACADNAAMKAEMDKKKKMEEMKKNDETVEVGGTTVSKSAVGDEQFSILKSLAAEVKKARDEADMAKFEKRAAEEFSHLPGTTADIAKALKAIGAMDAEVAKSVEAIMKAAEASNAKAFETNGVKKSEEVAKSYDQAVADIMKRDSVSKSVAIEKLGLENPDLVKSL